MQLSISETREHTDIFLFPTSTVSQSLHSYNCTSFFQLINFTFRAVSSSQKNWVESTETSYYSIPHSPCTQSSPVFTFCTMVEHLLQFMKLPWHILITYSIVYIKVHSWCCKFHEFWQMTLWVDLRSVIQNSFTALILSWDIRIHPSVSTNLWKSMIFLVSP